jgi:hypothetical protein
MSDGSGSETLDDFAVSLSYGARSDLSFKFMPRLQDGEIGDAVAGLLAEMGALLDSGDPAALIDRVIALQAEAYGRRAVSERYHYESAPFSTLDHPMSESTVALLTSSGHYVAGEDPGPLGVTDMSQQEAEDRISEFLKEEPVLSEIPIDLDRADLRVRHGGYDVRGVRLDPNVAFPVDALRAAAADGRIGSALPEAFSFVGACAQTRLIKQLGPAWAARLVRAGTDVVLLVPV